MAAKRRVCMDTSSQRKPDLSFSKPEENGILASTKMTASSTASSSKNITSTRNVKALKTFEMLDQSTASLDSSSHFICNSCDFTASTNEELDTHMLHQHVVKCFLCNFVSYSRLLLTRHVRHEHSDMLFSHNFDKSEDKDPCVTCTYCDFMTYSTELLEKHTISRHKEMSTKSFQQTFISKSVSAKVRDSDALFYSSLLLEADASDVSNEEADGHNFEPPSTSGMINTDNDKDHEDVSDHSNLPPGEGLLKSELSSTDKPDTVSAAVAENIPSETSYDVPPEESPSHTLPILKIEKETMYCLSCQIGDTDLDRLKFHMFTQHPTRAAVVGNAPSGITDTLPDVTFFCIKEACSYSTCVCSVYEEHLMNCCYLKEGLSEIEKRRLRSSLKCVLDFHQKHSLEAASGFLDFVYSMNKPSLSLYAHSIIQNDDQEYNGSSSREQINTRIQKKFFLQDNTDESHGDGQAKDSGLNRKEEEGAHYICCLCYQTFSAKVDFEHHMQGHHKKGQLEVAKRNISQTSKRNKSRTDLLKNSSEKVFLKYPDGQENLEDNSSSSSDTFLRYILQNRGKSPTRGVKLFKCDMCDKSFTGKYQYYVHMCLHTVERPFVCKECGKNFRQRSQLQDHMAIHQRHKPFKCNQCDKRFNRRFQLLEHMRIHAGEAPFVCNLCGKSYNHKSNLNEHMIKHSGERPFKCKHCDNTYVRKHELKMHMRLHTGEKPYICKVCGKEFRLPKHLENHMRTHSGEKPFKCDHCGRGFSDKSNLFQHKRTHTGEKPFSCNQCDKSFSQSGSLHVHMRVHTGEKPYMCNVCGSCFSSSSRFTGHMRRHTGVRPYKCEVCSKSFSEKNGLNRHILIHTGERPFQCSLCGKCFNRKSHLNYHTKTHEKERIKKELKEKA